MLAVLITSLKVKEGWKQATRTLEGLGTEYEKCLLYNGEWEKEVTNYVYDLHSLKLERILSKNEREKYLTQELVNYWAFPFRICLWIKASVTPYLCVLSTWESEAGGMRVPG